MSLARLSRAWYAQEFLRDLVLAYPIYAIMMGRAGVDPLGLSTLFIAWSGASLLAEIPAGALADRLSRRSILIAGQLLKAACFLVWWLHPSFGGFLAGFVMWGVAGSLRSGAAEALLHDSLAAHGAAKRFRDVYGRGEAAGAVGAALAMALGGWAANSGFALPLLLSAAAPIAAAAVTLAFIDEPAVGHQPEHPTTYLAILRAGLREAQQSTALRRPLLYLTTVALAYEVGEEYFGPLLDEARLQLPAIGALIAGTNVARAVGAFGAHRLGHLSGGRAWVLYLPAGILLVVVGSTTNAAVLASLTLFAALTAAARVVVLSRLQHAIAGAARATVTSVAGFGQELASLPLFLALGALAGRHDWSTAFAGLGAALIAGASVFAVTSRPSRERDRGRLD